MTSDAKKVRRWFRSVRHACPGMSFREWLQRGVHTALMWSPTERTRADVLLLAYAERKGLRT